MSLREHKQTELVVYVIGPMPSKQNETNAVRGKPIAPMVSSNIGTGGETIL
jgi:hypothetical protein